MVTPKNSLMMMMMMMMMMMKIGHIASIQSAYQLDVESHSTTRHHECC